MNTIKKNNQNNHFSNLTLNKTNIQRPQTFLKQSNQFNDNLNDLKANLKANTHSLGMVSAYARSQMVLKLSLNNHYHPKVLNALNNIERHVFVDTALASRSYEDSALPIGFKQTISQPSIVASMVSLACETRYTNGVWLEIGTGCGYQAAVIALCTDWVCSIERIAGLHQQAIKHLSQTATPLNNITVCLGDGRLPWANQGSASVFYQINNKCAINHHHHVLSTQRFDAIIVAAAGMSVLPVWLQQLNIGGRLIAPIQNEQGIQQLLMVERVNEHQFMQYILQTVQFVPLLQGIKYD